MCGRYTHLLTWRQIAGLYGLLFNGEEPVAPNDFGPRYNIAPTQKAPVVRERDGRRECVMLRWGLIPYWTKDPKIAYKTINARSETVATAPSFRAAFKARRCLIPTGGFHEWAKTADGKQPYLIGFKDSRAFSFAGLWESWKDRASGETIETYTIITCPPNEVAGKIHNRMPVIVDPSDFGRWLTETEPPADLPRRYPSAEMTAYSMSKAVGSPKNARPELIERAAV